MRFNGISDVLLLDLPFSFHFPKLKVFLFIVELYPGRNSIKWRGRQKSSRDESMRLSRDLQAWQFISREATSAGEVAQ